MTRTTASERLWLIVVALATFVPFVVLAIWAHAASASAYEQQVVDALALGENVPGDLVRALNTLGNTENWLVMTLVIAVVVGILRGGYAGLFVGATFLVDFAANITKALVERGRPDTVTAHALYSADSFGYPSGHTARAAALVGALLWVFVPERWRLPAAVVGSVIGGLVMGYARVALGVHFPSDVLGGLLLGIAWMAVTAALL